MRNLWERLAGHASNRMGRHFAVLILLFSSVVTLVSTVLQLGLEYRRDVNDITILLGQVRVSYTDSLASSLWITSTKDLHLQLEGILRLPDMQYIEVRGDAGQLVASAGTERKNSVVEREFPLYYNHRGRQVFIGKVLTVANLDGVYERMKDKVIVILITQTIKTFLVSLFILFLFQYLVGRHLQRIAAYSEGLSAGGLDQVLTLKRERSAADRDDELDLVVAALNNLRTRLAGSFTELQVANDGMEAQVRERTAQLQAVNQELEAFSYSVSHDLRSPLRGIDGWSLALQEDYGDKLDATANEYLERVRAETQRMGQLIDDMLQFSRLGRAALTMSEVDISALALTITRRINDSYPTRRFEFDIMPGIVAWGDWRLLEVVMTNLLENAAKFTMGREPAIISFGREDTTDPVSCLAVHAYFVRDNGAGFDMQFAPKLFGVFQRLHRHTEFPGTGIGLATVKRIVQRHGGAIWANARLGEGAVFHFTLKERT